MADIQDLEQESLGELEIVEDKIQQEVEKPKAVDDDLPQQFRGKSIKEIADYAASTERSLSRQGQELGEVRRLADDLLKAQLVQKSESEKPKEIDFFEDPQAAIRREIDNNPRVIASENHYRQMQIEQAKATLLRNHPDVGDIMQDPEFSKWVNGSKVRTSLFQHAENYDLDAAEELLSTFKELKGVRQKKEVVVDNTVRDATLRSVSVDTGGSGETSKKVYRRADLIRLKMREPDRYDAMSDEIMRAYNEGRVR